MKSAGKARNNGLYRHIRTSKEIIRNLLNDYSNCINSFIFIFGIIAFVSAIVIGIEAYDRGARRDHKENIDRYKVLK